MRARIRWAAVTAIGLVTAQALGAGCSGGGGDPERAARDREAAKPGWVLALDGTPGGLALERMDIYLSEDDTDPTPFEIRGDGVVLVGVIPASLAVGYEEDFGRLVGKTLAFDASGGDPGEPSNSSVTLDGVVFPVAGGAFTIEKLTGRWDGSEGDRTLHGRVEIRVLGSDGERTVRGKMSVHAVTWG